MIDACGWRRFAAAALVLGIGLTAGSAAAQRIQTAAEKVVTVPSGASALLMYDVAVQRFSIGDPEIADAVAISPTEVLVTGKKLGTTSLLVWQAGARVGMYSVQVTADAPALERYLGALFPEDGIAVSASANTVTLSGRVRSPGVARQAIEIAKGTGALVIDRLQAPAGKQVLLQVRFAEISRNARRALGTSLRARNPHELHWDDRDNLEGGTDSDGLVQLLIGEVTGDHFEAVIRALKARGEFRNWSGFGGALDMLEENPLPAVAIVTPKMSFQSSDTLNTLRDRVAAVQGVEEVRMDDSWFARLAALTGLAGQIAAIIGVLMIVAVFLVIGNSVRLSIFSRRDTINVMKLIGATDGFILRPFLNGGAMLGFAGALLSLVLSGALVWQLESVVAGVAKVFGTTFTLHGLGWDEALLLLIISAMIGWIAAWLATVQHLRRFTPQ